MRVYIYEQKEEEDTCMLYEEEEDTCMSYEQQEEEDKCLMRVYIYM
jgi:hypothetical protein